MAALFWAQMTPWFLLQLILRLWRLCCLLWVIFSHPYRTIFNLRIWLYSINSLIDSLSVNHWQVIGRAIWRRLTRLFLIPKSFHLPLSMRLVCVILRNTVTGLVLYCMLNTIFFFYYYCVWWISRSTLRGGHENPGCCCHCSSRCLPPSDVFPCWVTRVFPRSQWGCQLLTQKSMMKAQELNIYLVIFKFVEQ